MDYGGGSWSMVPTQNPGSQDLHSLHPYQQQLQFQSNPQLQQQQQQQQLQQLQQQQQQQPQQQQQQHHHHQSLASDFHLLHLVENLAGALESGTRDQQHLDSLVNELTTRFNNCQQLLNSISGSINAKAVTVEGQRRKLEEAEQLLNQRRDVINKYKSSVGELVNPDSRR